MRSLFLITLVLLIVAYASSVSASYCRKTTAALNVRSGPSTGYSIIKTLPEGTQINVNSESNGWAEIGGGYVSSTYLTNCPSVCKQTTDALNVRSGPGTGYSVLRTLAAGTQVQVSGSSNGWAQIGSGQYVSEQYLGSCGSGPAPGPGTGDLSVAQLRSIMPNLAQSRADQLIGNLNSALREASITTCARKSAFLAQVAHESGQLQWFEEFASGDAYEGRSDLCNNQPGDGRRFKGRGPIQLTGRCNYTNAGRALGLDLVGNPYQVSTFAVGFRTTAWFWNSRNLNSYADQNTQASFDSITLRVNGGYNGKADRDKYWYRAKSVLGC